jgi:lysophospholipase L1-like esterase
VNGDVTPPVFRRFVAIGDSLTEGLGDDRFHWDRRYAGWADRLAAIVHESNRRQGENLAYANLAVRSRKVQHVMSTQLDHALALTPDLVTVMAGGNDLWRTGIDWVALRRLYRDGLARLCDSGATVLVANSINPVHVRAFAAGRGRAARMTELIESVAAEMNCGVIDLFRLSALHDVRSWARDRVHFGQGAHSYVANHAADLLGLTDRILMPENEMLAHARRTASDWFMWITNDVAPFYTRVARGTTAGDKVVAKRPQLSSIDGHPWSIVSTNESRPVGPVWTASDEHVPSPSLAVTR